ncbi:PAOX [Branchiostoma lanceolatum]|uniref:PAOX protein n=2 Tax=Branchiostoma lanceolatum TaxID=7740 RepID=A0A8J9ZQ48_BRALA|nr:PAOX [Branchiostoma lanceolatum]
MASTGVHGSRRPQVVVVGGGMAGVAAAQRLVQEGLTHVKILEARDRVGGRIWTQYFGSDTTLEFGGNWIHGSIGNPIYELAKQHGLLRDEVKPEDLDRPNVRELENEKFLMPGGKVIDEAVVVSFLKNYNEVIEECDAVFKEGRPVQPGDSAGDFIRQELPKQLALSNDIDAVKCTKMALLKHFLKLETCITGCHDMGEESLEYFGQYKELEGDHYNNPSGYNVILDLILKTIPPDCMAYNKKVQCIRWRGEGKKRSESAHSADGVEVECEDGQVFSADHVIVTVPLGYLKKNSRNLFQPPLPEEKLASIERMGFGVVNKIFLTFQKPFWDTDCEALHLVWDQDESNPKGPEEWYKKTYCFYIDSKAPNTLLGWISGREAEYMETLSEEEIADTFVGLLKKFTGKEDIPQPVRTMITRWGSDALTCGSYSYIHVGEKGDDINTVAEPLYRDNTEIPVVQFAGEATHSEFFSTVHGAYLSGQREANRLVNLYASSETSKS